MLKRFFSERFDKYFLTNERALSGKIKKIFDWERHDYHK